MQRKLETGKLFSTEFQYSRSYSTLFFQTALSALFWLSKEQLWELENWLNGELWNWHETTEMTSKIDASDNWADIGARVYFV